MTEGQTPRLTQRITDGIEPGPSLRTYLETRFDLIITSIKDKAHAQDAALLAFVDATKQSALALKAATDAQALATDLRYQQRFEAQSDALAAAFLSQQTAMKTALEAAKEAVNAALAAADRAVLKAELAADKRFEALNELRQMLNDMVGTLITKSEADQRFTAMSEKFETLVKHVDTLEGRQNVSAGEQVGGRRSKDDTRMYVTVGISIVGVLILLATFIIARVNSGASAPVIYVPAPPGTTLPATPPATVPR